MKISEIWLWRMTCWLEDGSSTQSALTRSSTTWRGRWGERETCLPVWLVGGISTLSTVTRVITSDHSVWPALGTFPPPSVSSFSLLTAQSKPSRASKRLSVWWSVWSALVMRGWLRLLIWISGGPHSAHTNSANRNLNDLDKNRNWYKWSLSLMRS